MAYDWVTLAIQIGYVLVILVAGVLIVGIVGMVTWLIMKSKAYSKHKVVVFSRHRTDKGSEVLVIEDLSEKGAIKYDKKLKRYHFHLKNANCHLGSEETKSYDEIRDLDIPSTPFSKGGKVVFVEKLGVKKYAFGEPFVIYGKPVVIVSAADCAEAQRAYDMNAKTFGKKDNQLLAFIIYILFATLILVLVIFVLTKIQVLTEDGIKVIVQKGLMDSQVVASNVPG